MATVRDVSDAQIERARDEGWAVVRGFFVAEEAQSIRRDISALTQLDPLAYRDIYFFKAGPGQGAPILNRIEHFVEYAPTLGAGEVWRRLHRVAERYLGEKAVLFKDKVNLRQPQSTGFGPHQDAAAGWGEYAERFVSLGFFVHASNWNVGGMEFVNRAHLSGFLPNEKGQLAASWYDPIARERPDVYPEDLLVLDGMTPHGSNTNGSPNTRQHVFLTYCTGSDPQVRARYFTDKLATFRTDPTDGCYDFRLFAYGLESAHGK